MIHSDAPSTLDGLLLMLLAGLIGYFFIEQRPATCVVGVVLAYGVLMVDRWQRSH